MAVIKQTIYQCDRCGSRHQEAHQGLKQGKNLFVHWSGDGWATYWDGASTGSRIESKGWLCSPCSDEFLRFMNSTEKDVE